MTHPAEKDAPCCNALEPEGVMCEGTMHAGWPTFICDICRAHCGAVVHPVHAPMTTTAEQIGYCATCGVVVSRYHADNPAAFHPIHPD